MLSTAVVILSDKAGRYGTGFLAMVLLIFSIVGGVWTFLVLIRRASPQWTDDNKIIPIPKRCKRKILGKFD
jgi:hypothetical protein